MMTERADRTAGEDRDAIVGSILGTAVGDALGLAAEGMSRRRQRKVFPDIGRYHLIFNKGMISDDTEHTAIVAQALIVSGGEAKSFSRSLGWRLRFWLIMLPAGIGFATLRALIKLCIGFPPSKSGVFSAGNGPAMRAPVIGAAYGHDRERMRQLVKASTLVTHKDPKAHAGALAAALAADLSARAKGKVDPDLYLTELKNEFKEAGLDDEEFLGLAKKAAESVKKGETSESFMDGLGLQKGVTGYMYHTMPAVLHSWFAKGCDFSGALETVIRLGGDSDTTAAILGGIVGAAAGRDGIPEALLDNLWEWPRKRSWLESLGEALSLSVTGEDANLPSYAWWALLPRNLAFMVVVLAHGFRRLLPPY